MKVTRYGRKASGLVFRSRSSNAMESVKKIHTMNPKKSIRLVTSWARIRINEIAPWCRVIELMKKKEQRPFDGYEP